jgi:hypothetical protein
MVSRQSLRRLATATAVVVSLLAISGWSANAVAVTDQTTSPKATRRARPSYCCWPLNMGTVIVDGRSADRLLGKGFKLGSSTTAVLEELDRYGWPHTQPRPALISPHEAGPCTEHCRHGTVIEAWARCKSMIIVTYTFPFVGRYGLVWKEDQYTGSC